MSVGTTRRQFDKTFKLEAVRRRKRGFLRGAQMGAKGSQGGNGE